MSTNPPVNPAAGPWRRLAAQAALIALALACLAWRAWPDGRLHVYFLEARGDAALIQTPSGGFVLLDGGADPAALTAALGRHMPFWRRTLDAVVLTSAGGAPLPGQVAALARYPARLALAPPLAGRGALLAEWRRLLQAGGTRTQTLRAGARIDLGGAALRVLAANAGAEGGLLLRLEYGVTSVVFDQGGEAAEQALAGASLPRADLLAFPWQRDPRTPLVAALRPRALVYTDGTQADQPAELTFLERAIGGAQVFHERLDGTITWTSDGARAWIVAER